MRLTLLMSREFSAPCASESPKLMARGKSWSSTIYTEQGAIRRDPATGLYVIDFEKMPVAIASLAKELLEQEATGDRARTEAWFKKYGGMPAELERAARQDERHSGGRQPRIRFPSIAAMRTVRRLAGTRKGRRSKDEGVSLLHE